jgi:N-formylglutamate deformylase
MTFRELAPKDADLSWVLVEAPHAGTRIPVECLPELIVPAQSIGRDADLYVDELYADAPTHGATLLTTDVSRYVVDLNRSEEDIDSESVARARTFTKAPRGVIWRLSGDREPVLAKPLTAEQFEHRMESYYRPYHARLRALILERRERFGKVLVIAAHSMPSVSRELKRGPDLESVRADVVPGTRGKTSAGRLYIDAVEHFFRDNGLEVRHDIPYAGGYTTTFYGRPLDHVHVIQLELSRRLYMDETTLSRKDEPFARLRGLCGKLVRTLSAL